MCTPSSTTLVPKLTRSAVLVGKSTVPVGTAAELGQRAAALARPGVDVEIAWNPEFLREGFAVHDTLEPDRIVLGVQDGSPRAEAVVRELYAPMLDAGVPFLVTDLQTAELVKVSANAFLATKISFINAISEVCEAAGADVTLLADALGYDPRIGRKFLNAGLGFGGGCLPKDIRAFMARAGELGANQALTFLREVDSINMRRRTKMVELATAACGGSLLGANIAVLGAAFKPESDDVRDSPALNVAGQLQLNGAAVNVYDPKALDNARRQFPTLNYAVSVDGGVRGRRRRPGAHRVAGVRRPRPRRLGRPGARPGHRRRPQLPRCRALAAGRLAGVQARRAQTSGPLGAPLIHDQPVVYAPILNRLAGIDFGPTLIEYQVDLVIARVNLVFVDVDDAIPGRPTCGTDPGHRAARTGIASCRDAVPPLRRSPSADPA